MITLCNVHSAPAASSQPLSIAVADAHKANSLAIFMPTWAMVGGWKRGQGDQRPWCAKYKPLTTAQYIDAYRQLMLQRKADIAHWARANSNKQHALYCYCAKMPEDFDTNDLSGEVWFCHRLLVYHLFRRWFSTIDVQLV